MENSGHIDARQYLRIFWKRKSLWMLPPVVILCTVAIGVNLMPPVYEASATIQYDDRPNLTRQLQELTGMASQGGRSEELAQQRTMDMVATLKSRQFLEGVARTLRLNDDPLAVQEGRKVHEKRPEITAEEATMQLLVMRLRQRLSVEPTGYTVFRVVVRDNYPENAQLLAKWVSQLFVDQTKGGFSSQIRVAGDFSQEEMASYEKKLRASEDGLRSFQESMLGRQLAANPVGEKTRDQARSLVRQAAEEMADFSRQRAALAPSARLSEKAEASLVHSGNLPALSDQLNRAEVDLGVLLLDKPQTDVAVAAQKDRVGHARQQVYDALTAAAAARFPNASATEQADIRDFYYAMLQEGSVHARHDRLQAYLTEYERNFRESPRAQLELDRLRQDVEVNRKLLETFRSQSISSQISQKVDATSLGIKVNILDPPTRPIEPVSPDKPRVFLFALILGPLLGFGAVFLAEYVDSSYRNVEEIEAEIGIPVMGTMPRPNPGGGVIPIKRNRWVPITVSAAVAVTVVFFALKMTVLPDLGLSRQSAHATDPGTPRSGRP